MCANHLLGLDKDILKFGIRRCFLPLLPGCPLEICAGISLSHSLSLMERGRGILETGLSL